MASLAPRYPADNGSLSRRQQQRESDIQNAYADKRPTIGNVRCGGGRAQFLIEKLVGDPVAAPTVILNWRAALRHWCNGSSTVQGSAVGHSATIQVDVLSPMLIFAGQTRRNLLHMAGWAFSGQPEIERPFSE